MGTRLTRSKRAAVVPNSARETTPRFGTPTTSRSAWTLSTARLISVAVSPRGTARVNGGDGLPLQGNGELQAPARIAYQLVLVLLYSLADRSAAAHRTKHQAPHGVT